MIEAVIFDNEGVIIDTEGLWDRGQQEFLEKRGFIYHREQIKPLLTGRSVLEGARILKERFKLPEKVEALANERIEIIKDVIRREVDFIPGFLAFHQFLRNRNIKMAIATSMHEDLLEIAKDKLALHTLFQKHIYSLVHVNFVSKPNPDIFLHAAKQLEVAPKNCVVIEDAPHGIRAAQRAKMKCIAIATTYSIDRLKKCNPNQIIKQFSEINLDKL